MSSDLRTELERIKKKHGKLKSQHVVDEWRTKRSRFHDRLEWDDAVAGEKYRLQQVREIIAELKIEYRDSKGRSKSVRAFHSIRDEDGYAYQSTDEVVADPFLTKIVLADMERDWTALRDRYDRFKEFWEMVRRDVA